MVKLNMKKNTYVQFDFQLVCVCISALCFAHLLFIGNGYLEAQWLCVCVLSVCIHKSQIAESSQAKPSRTELNLILFCCRLPRCFIMAKSYWNCNKFTAFTMMKLQNWNWDRIKNVEEEEQAIVTRNWVQANAAKYICCTHRIQRHKIHDNVIEMVVEKKMLSSMRNNAHLTANNSQYKNRSMRK